MRNNFKNAINGHLQYFVHIWKNNNTYKIILKDVNTRVFV